MLLTLDSEQCGSMVLAAVVLAETWVVSLAAVVWCGFALPGRQACRIIGSDVLRLAMYISYTMGRGVKSTIKTLPSNKNFTL